MGACAVVALRRAETTQTESGHSGNNKGQCMVRVSLPPHPCL